MVDRGPTDNKNFGKNELPFLPTMPIYRSDIADDPNSSGAGCALWGGWSFACRVGYRCGRSPGSIMFATGDAAFQHFGHSLKHKPAVLGLCLVWSSPPKRHFYRSASSTTSVCPCRFSDSIERQGRYGNKTRTQPQQMTLYISSVVLCSKKESRQWTAFIVRHIIHATHPVHRYRTSNTTCVSIYFRRRGTRRQVRVPTARPPPPQGKKTHENKIHPPIFGTYKYRCTKRMCGTRKNSLPPPFGQISERTFPTASTW